MNIESLIISCNHRFKAFSHSPGYWAIDLHDLWRQFIWCAKGTPADDTRQDMRTSQILHIKEHGIVTNTEKEPREALTEEGESIWVDLPYLTADFLDVWQNALGMKTSHMTNLAAFTARLVRAGVRTDELAFCMLQLCKQVLETEQPMSGAPLVELLPAVFQWFKHCGEKLNRLCISNYTVAEDAKISPGPLARAAGVHRTGFSPDRWQFWRKVVKDFALSKDEKLAIEGRRVFDQMVLIGRLAQNKLSGEAVVGGGL